MSQRLCTTRQGRSLLASEDKNDHSIALDEVDEVDIIEAHDNLDSSNTLNEDDDLDQEDEKSSHMLYMDVNSLYGRYVIKNH